MLDFSCYQGTNTLLRREKEVRHAQFDLSRAPTEKYAEHPTAATTYHVAPNAAGPAPPTNSRHGDGPGH